jgi:hypothetical protein
MHNARFAARARANRNNFSQPTDLLSLCVEGFGGVAVQKQKPRGDNASRLDADREAVQT